MRTFDEWFKDTSDVVGLRAAYAAGQNSMMLTEEQADTIIGRVDMSLEESRELIERVEEITEVEV